MDPGSNTAPKGTSQSLKIRDIPTCQRYFWKGSLQEQRAQVVLDQTPEYGTRKLPSHEHLTLAFQEIAAARGRSFFFYLPTRAALTSNPGVDRLPPERHMPREISADYPEMLVMNFGWSDQDQKKFWESSHRQRYLRSGFLTNAPPFPTPMIPIQYIDRANVAVSLMSTESLILFDNNSDLYLITSSELSNIFGHSKTTIRKPSNLWKRSDIEKGNEAEREAKRRKLDELQSHSYGSFSRISVAGYTAPDTRRSTRDLGWLSFRQWRSWKCRAAKSAGRSSTSTWYGERGSGLT